MRITVLGRRPTHDGARPRGPRRPLTIAGVVGALVAPLALASPAAALDDAKPSPSCGPYKSDSRTDGTNNSFPTQVRPQPQNLQITGVFLKHEPDKGAEATTANIQIADLHRTVPLGSNGLVWSVQWQGPNGTKFVRAVIDYTGHLVFEHGVWIPPIEDIALARYEFRGTTTGKLFEGKDGVVQIVIPPDVDGRAGTNLSSIYAQSAESRTVVPNALQTPTRGLSNPMDRAPDDGLFLKWQPIAACPAP